jgi:hypothetical protein
MVMELIQAAPPALVGTASVMLVLFVAFLLFFLLPAIGLRLRLAKVLRRLRSTNRDNLKDLQSIFEQDKKLQHLWKEFRDTLHAQREEREGQLVVRAWRATTPAEAFFNGQYVVDGRLRTEFFKHLPGIFTGIGIIGTFLGLITGLQAFKVSEDAGQVRESLELLLGGVFEAFLVSASAIALAMFVTLIEKLLLASLYRCTEAVAQHLDSLFATGATEEYLARLAHASEESASQAKILKDSLVGDLKGLLQEMTERQIAAQAAQSQELGRQIAGGIQTSLQEPLKQIGDIVAKASADQSATAGDLLKDVMTSFSQRLNELFGGQISGIQELNQKSAQTMQEAVTALHTLVGRMEGAANDASANMADKMAKAIEQMEQRQSAINQQTENAVAAIKQMVEESQSNTSSTLNSAISDLGKQVTEMVTGLQAQAARSHEEQQKREDALATRTEGVVVSLGGTVSEVVKEMAASTEQMRQAVAALERTTTMSIDKLNTGAQTLEQGAKAFALAGERVTGSLEKATTVADKMAEVSGSLTSSSAALQNVLADYRANRDATTALLGEVRVIMEAAKREASLSKEVLERIDSAATKLGAAQRDAEEYLEGISDVLAKAHESFGDALFRTLDRANSDFHTKLDSAVKMLHSTIEELDSTLAGATSTRG